MKGDPSYFGIKDQQLAFSLASGQLIVAAKNDETFMLRCSSHIKPPSLRFKEVNMSTPQNRAP